ncbi:hypothetical protein DV736_g5477, partial [Chaetothyriales sp. CBS 134916]
MSLPRVSPDSPYFGLPLTNLQSVILTSGPFVFFWSLLRRYISRARPILEFGLITHINSLLYAIFSAGLAYLIWQSYFEPEVQIYEFPFQLPILDTKTLVIETWMLGYAYHVSKFYEYVDIFNLVAQGLAISTHMAFHHITTPYLTYSRIISMPLSSLTTTPTSGWLTHYVSLLPPALVSALSSPDWRVFALANSIHHAIMYAYFSRVPGTEWLRSVIPLTGWLQLALGIGTDALWMFATNGGKDLNSSLAGSNGSDQEVTNRAISIMLLTRYAMLYWDERTQIVLAEKQGKRRLVRRKQREEVEREKKNE